MEYTAELYKRLKAYRLAYPMTQKELADKAGVSLRSVQNAEKGRDIQLSIFIKMITALGLQDNMLSAFPDMDDRPSAHMLRAKGMDRQRVRKKKTTNEKRFVWGDEK
ncbi:MAG: helix-turn-helix domain-containing protein [Lachnospiraceae bacterium]|nr:helix-turn-helix domain-containing protein [Lachnospiraceae bacterium]